MSTMTDTIMQQVSEQVKKVVRAASLARPVPCFKHMPSGGYERSCRRDPAISPCRSERIQEDPHGGGDHHGCLAWSSTASTPYATHSRQTAWFEELERTSCPQRRVSEQQRTLERGSDHEHPELSSRSACKRSPHAEEIASLDLDFLRKEREPARPEPQDEECLTEIVATIAGEYAEGITWSTWKAQQVLTAEQGSRITVPTMVFEGERGPPVLLELHGHHHMGLLEEADISWKGHRPSGPPHPRLWGQEVNPTGMIRLPLCIRGNGKAKNVEVDFLVVDVPTAYNIIQGRPYPAPSEGCHRPLPTSAPI
ncbi:hypothetical protein Cgig2_024889 [Carnegiea gigantea]|uniref:Uncharacterized protein n=1 Tax=Carnegiea gigantea TaxID=171969 RepID=A0A9Q1Q4S2_9CARY|nr:hypothetical protein Cgig2_024889 [Carnegiea gigantea]